MSELKSSNEPISCKVILVGDSGVGKTSIINRYLKQYSENQKATIGASYANKLEKIDDFEINFDIWDTAGQERFRSVNTIFYKEAYVCIMVYDITKPESFESIKDYWYNTVSDNASGKIIYGIAGNKIDLYEEEKVDQNKVKEYCDSIDALFKATSAKQNTCIDDIFKELGKKFIQSDLFKYLISQNTDNNKKLDLNKSDKKKKKGCC
jgi:small GTP-binding protein